MRNMYTIEVRIGGGWQPVRGEWFTTLKAARGFRDGWCRGYVTRIQKWVKPCKKTHR